MIVAWLVTAGGASVLLGCLIGRWLRTVSAAHPPVQPGAPDG